MVGEVLSHYRILGLLGSGGMGDVYRAEDLRLGRHVALKTIKQDDLSGETAARLLAEARAASALNHPNVAVVYEASEVERDGVPLAFIAMEFVDGTTVAELARGGRIDLDRVLDIVEQTADALAEAHARGLVHRDIKPSNVMVTPAGRVKVLDFGVAQRRDSRAELANDTTRTGNVWSATEGFVGTLPYTAPEQVLGLPVDGRADLFSLGVMLYELASGSQPFGGENTSQRLDAMLRDELRPFPDLDRDDRLRAIERLAARLLSRDPARRPATSADVRAAIAAIRRREALADSDDPSFDARSLAVMPFANISGNPEDDWLGTGIPETLTADLGQVDGLTLVPRQRVSQVLKTLQHAEVPAERILVRAGQELRARWMLSGGFQRAGGAVRVTALLDDLASGHARTAKVDGRFDAIFELQDRLVRDVAGTLRAVAGPATSSSRETDVLDAYEAFSRGLLNRAIDTYESLDRAVLFFERAVRLDPGYAKAHMELGTAYAVKADYLSMAELRPLAVASLRRALELQPDSARVWRELGATLVSLGQDEEGVAAIRRALELDPREASAHAAMGRALFIGEGRFREAMTWFERALQLSPKAGWYALQLAHCAALERDFTKGEAAARCAVAMQEAALSGQEGVVIVGSHMRIGHLAALQGDHAGALAHFQREIDFLTQYDHGLRNRILVELNARLGQSYQQLGETARANAAFETSLEGFDRRVRLGADDPFTRYYAAGVHALRGDTEHALAYLERAIEQQRGFTIARARIEPEFAGLRSEARFQALVG